MTYNKSKFNNIKKVIDGIKFDSQLEAAYYLELQRLKVKIIEFQPKVRLTDANILYKPDFLIVEDGQKVYIDVKGMQTPVFNIKKRLWKSYGPGRLILVKKNASGWYYSDIIDNG